MIEEVVVISTRYAYEYLKENKPNYSVMFVNYRGTCFGLFHPHKYSGSGRYVSRVEALRHYKYFKRWPIMIDTGEEFKHNDWLKDIK